MLILILFDYHEIALHLHSVETPIFTFLLEDIFNTVPQKEVYIIYVYVLSEKFQSTSMARGLTLSAVLTAFIALVLVHETRSVTAKVNDHCAPSSCGTIRNIGFPFRLKTDPKKCGERRYELSCENNHTVLSLFERKYNVKKINYNNYTIRIVDSGIQKDNYSSTPSYSLNVLSISFFSELLHFSTAPNHSCIEIL